MLAIFYLVLQYRNMVFIKCILYLIINIIEAK